MDPAAKKRAEIIDKLPISDMEKVDLTLVCAGVKPATIIDVYTFNHPDRTRYVYALPEEIIRKVVRDLQSIGIPYLLGTLELQDNGYTIRGDEKFKNPPIERFSIYVGKDQNWLKRIKEAATDEELGACYGFPETAIEAYGGKRKRLPYDAKLPDELKTETRFADFVMSEDNWREEVKTGKQWGKTIRELNPRLYDRIVNPEMYGISVVRARPATDYK